MRRGLEPRPQDGVRFWFPEPRRHRHHARPDVQRVVLRLVRRPAGPDLHRSLGERQRERGRGGQLLLGGLPRVGPLPGSEVLGDGPQRQDLFGGLGNQPGHAEDRGAAVVHRVVEDRPRADQPVQVRDGDAHLLSVAGHDARVRGRPVQVQQVPEAAVAGGQYARHAVDDHPEMADQAGIEHGIQVVAFGPATLVMPAEYGTRGAGEVRQAHDHSRYALSSRSPGSHDQRMPHRTR